MIATRLGSHIGEPCNAQCWARRSPRQSANRSRAYIRFVRLLQRNDGE
jgi:hypothetical protein